MTSVAGHFGEWLQGLMGGRVVLVTMACPALQAHAGGALRLFPADAMVRFCELLGLAGPVPGVTLDMPAGGGAGASTAALVAVARAMGFEGSPEDLARACLKTEGACDPLMFNAPDQLVWASRTGEIVDRLPAPPRAEVVGGFWGPPLRTNGEDCGFPDVTDLVQAWREAVTCSDLPAAASVATASAQRCDTLRGPADPMAVLAGDLGALGRVRAHTGSARGLIFAPGEVPERACDMLREAGLTGVLRFTTGGDA
ncbi:uncharacterized protein involved in propanediol utilization [Sagittula marina]|uniref:Uncharacterized protein involved in propanediol utilization n=1 Tax=Sagittula marina TaxID=943940 RepID=A0A7W6DTS1_9RHOB|nr:uncharacterized protein involved in propanediol utilization [Sagittula marina]